MTPAVLMVVYYFPPQGSVQVLRALKFAKYLPEFGWKPVILSVKNILHYYNDPELIKDLPESVEILRTGSLDPFRLMAITSGKSKNTDSQVKQEISKSFFRFRNVFNELNRWLALPDSRFGWYPFAVSQGRKAIKNHNIKIIYS